MFPKTSCSQRIITSTNARTVNFLLGLLIRNGIVLPLSDRLDK